MMTEVMTFVMKGWHQPGIPAVRINRKSFAIWLSRMKLIAPHKCRIKWSVYSRDSWNNLLFAFPTLVLVLLLRVRWLIGLARSWSHHPPLSCCKSLTGLGGVHAMLSLYWRRSCCVLGTGLTEYPGGVFFLELVAWGSFKYWLEAWGQGSGGAFHWHGDNPHHLHLPKNQKTWNTNIHADMDQFPEET